MNSLERTRKAIRGEVVDRIPTFPILLAPACELLGVKQRDYFLKPVVMADTLIRARELINADGIYVITGCAIRPWEAIYTFLRMMSLTAK